MNLYKFRSLCAAGTLKRTIGILESGRFWCSRFWELNDPMEGVYRLQPSSPDYRAVFTEKAARVLCSFSGATAMLNPLMWGYYANGFKGVAIEIEIEEKDVREVKYSAKVTRPDTGQGLPGQVDEILCCKLINWKHEAEYRFLTDGDRGERQIGTITSITLGVPYPRTLVDHPNRLRLMPHLTQYLNQCRRVVHVAKRCGYRVDTATIQSGNVEIQKSADIEALYNG